MGVIVDASRGIRGPKSGKGRILFLCYLFPPVGGAGVQRPVKFIKYLSELGWEITVLTVSNPSVPVFDESLLDDIPSSTEIRKAATLEPDYRYKARIASKQGVAGNPSSVEGGASVFQLLKGAVRSFGGMLLQPDPQVLWLPGASREALNILREVPHDLIFATAPPYSSLLLGSWLKKKTGIPLILDFRDEWDLSNAYRENSRRDGISLLIQRRMKRGILKNADGIVATTKASTRKILERAKEMGVENLSGICVYNGYDESDFKTGSSIDAEKEKEDSKFRILYTGTLWNLTSVEPLVKAMERLAQVRPGMVEEVSLTFVGRKMSHQMEILKRLEALDCRLELRDYCNHSEATALMGSADVLCLLLSDVEGAERVVPAKLFEYLAARKEILAITPPGEAADIVSRYYPSNHFANDDISGIAAWLEKRIATRKGRNGVNHPEQMDISEFSRKHQAALLNDYLMRFVHPSSTGKGKGAAQSKEGMNENVVQYSVMRRCSLPE